MCFDSMNFHFSRRNRSIGLVLLALIFIGWPFCARADETISVWCMGAEGKAIEPFARRFEREHPGTRVKTQAIPWGGARDRMITSLVGNIAPDVMQLGTTWAPELAAIDALEPLDPLLAQSKLISKASFFPASLAGAHYQGKLVSLPWYVETRVVFYRSDLLREAGWNHYPETWNELETLGLRFQEIQKQQAAPERYLLSLPVHDDGAFLNFVWQNGGDVLDASGGRLVFDSPQTAQALDFYRNFIHRRFSPLDVAGQIDPMQAFGRGYIASWISGPWMVEEVRKRLPELAGRWAVAMVPGRVNRNSLMGGSNLVILKSTRNRALAWSFIEFMSRPELQADWFRATGDLPSSPAAWQRLGLDADPVWGVFRKQIEQGHAAPAVENWQAMADRIRDGVQEAVLSERPSREVIGDVQAKLQAMLNARKAPQGNLAGARALQPQHVRWIFYGLVATLVGLLVLRRRQLWRHRIALMFLSPILLLFCVFLLLPTLASLGLSLTDYDLYSLRDWRRTSFVGISNYASLLRDPVFWQAVVNTAYFVCVAGPVTLVMGLLTAVGIHRMAKRLRGASTVALFLPVLTPMVAVAVVWQWIYAPNDGLLNGFLHWLGLDPVAWLSNPLTAMPALIILAVWKNFGYGMVIFLGGLQSIPQELYEAGTIDGANPWQSLRHITLPMLRPMLIFVAVLTTIGFMQFFAEPFIMTDQGGPRNRTLSIVLYLYKTGFTSFQLGYASAIAYTLCLMIAAISLLQTLLGRRKAGAA